MKIHLYGRFKIDALGPSQKRCTKEVFLGGFEDVHKTFLLNCKDKRQQATHLVSRIEYNTAVMCFVFCLKLTSLGRPKDVTMQTSL